MMTPFWMSGVWRKERGGVPKLLGYYLEWRPADGAPDSG